MCFYVCISAEQVNSYFIPRSESYLLLLLIGCRAAHERDMCLEMLPEAFPSRLCTEPGTRVLVCCRGMWALCLPREAVSEGCILSSRACVSLLFPVVVWMLSSQCWVTVASVWLGFLSPVHTHLGMLPADTQKRVNYCFVNKLEDSSAPTLHWT